jgi:hypothetical protein
MINILAEAEPTSWPDVVLMLGFMALALIFTRLFLRQ